MEKKWENYRDYRVCPGDPSIPSIQMTFALGPKVCKHSLHWAVGILRATTVSLISLSLAAVVSQQKMVARESIAMS